MKGNISIYTIRRVNISPGIQPIACYNYFMAQRNTNIGLWVDLFDHTFPFSLLFVVNFLISFSIVLCCKQ